MREQATRLENFYASPLGLAAQRMIHRRLAALWRNVAGKDILGFGYPFPALQPYLDIANRVVLAMPEEQGALAQSNRRGVMTCLTEEDRLPFSDAKFDLVLCLHGAEESPNINMLFRELWRVTQPEGRIVVIAANRAGLWSRSDTLPFGAGRPFSKRQLKNALSNAGFQPTVSAGALYVPPVKWLTKPRIINGFEKFGETVWPTFSGLVLVEAVKRLYAEPEALQRGYVKRPKFGSNPIANREAKRAGAKGETKP